MINERFGKIKGLQFSDSHEKWIYTLLFLPLAIYFRFIIGTSLILDKDYTALLRSTWILGVLFLVWILWKWLLDNRLAITGLEPFLAGFLLVVCLSTFSSENSSYSLEKLIGIAAYILGFYILLDLKRYPNLWQGIIQALVITAGFSSGLILISALPWVELYQLTPGSILANPTSLLKVLPRLPYSLGLHQSVTAGYLVMVIPLAIHQFLNTRRGFWKAAQIVGILLNTSVLLLTQSRGGLLGLLTAALVFGFLYHKKITEAVNRHKLLGILLGLILLLLGGGILVFLARTRGFDIGGITVQMRLHQWRAGFQIIQQRPLLGAGLGTYGQKYLEIRDPVFYPGTFIHAHNQLIQITAELGILGLASLTLIIWQAIRLLQRKQGELPAGSKTALIGLGGLFGVLIPDAILTSAMIVLLLLIYLAWILPADRLLVNQDRSKALSILSITGVLILGCFGWMIWKIHPYDQALRASAKKDWASARTALEDAQARDPENPYYLHALGFAVGQLACQAEENAAQATWYFDQAFGVYPNWGIDRANAGVLHAINGDYQNAAAQMELAIQEYPQHGRLNCLLGDYYSQLNRTGDAFSAYTDCILKGPGVIDSPYWREDPTRADLLPDLITAAESRFTSREDESAKKLLSTLYRSAGETDLAEEVIQEYLAVHPADLGGNLIYLKILDDKEDLIAAEDRIKKLLSAHPRSPDLWLYQGKLEQQRGDLSEAEAAFTLSLRLEPSPVTLSLLGTIYALQGDLEQAESVLSSQVQVTPPYRMGDFSRQVAGRWPIRELFLDCTPGLKTYRDDIEPVLDAAAAVQAENCSLAACIYQDLIDLPPGSVEAAERLDILPCSDSFDPDQCVSPLSE